MKKFNVTVYLDASIDVIVEADNKSEAVQKASAMSLEEMGLEFTDTGVIGIESLERDGNYSIEEVT